MAGETSDELLQQVRGGELDARRILLTPDFAPGAADVTLEALLAPSPRRRRGGDSAWARLDAERGARIGDLDPDRRFWIADLLNFWRSAPEASRASPRPRTACTRRRRTSTSRRARRAAALCAARDAGGAQGDVREHPRLRLRLRARDAVPPRRVPGRPADRLRHRRPTRSTSARRSSAPSRSTRRRTSRPLELPGPFDMIWVGSLFTHVPEARWIELLDLLGPC